MSQFINDETEGYMGRLAGEPTTAERIEELASVAADISAYLQQLDSYIEERLESSENLTGNLQNSINNVKLTQNSYSTSLYRHERQIQRLTKIIRYQFMVSGLLAGGFIALCLKIML